MSFREGQFLSVSQWYVQFPQTDEAEVIDLLHRAWEP